MGYITASRNSDCVDVHFAPLDLQPRSDNSDAQDASGEVTLAAMTPSTLLLDLPDLTVRRTVVSKMANNVYVLTAKQTGTQVLIDAADDAPTIVELLASAAGDATAPVTLKLIATTHRHWDHTRALASLHTEYNVSTAAGREDAESIRADTGVATDRLIDHGDVLDIEGISLTAVHLRGHTPGSIAYVLESSGATVIFSGDSLFPGGVGNTEQDPQRFSSLLADVTERLFGVYPDDSLVLPGHGDTTKLGTERPSLAEWLERGW
jgi:glyoxylase-like metal-dependent hydrolase (beta-lactamase superfamily II)